MRLFFCPTPYCAFHDPALARRFPGWFRRAGTHPTRVVGAVQRYHCRFCRRAFSDRTFDIDYYTKRKISYAALMTLVASSASVRAASRILVRSPGSILNRIDRLSRECLARHERLLASLPLSEDLAADGFESFDCSQYHPNNIQLLVGSSSQFIYGFSHTSLRRKGRMTEAQRRSREDLEHRYRAPRDGIRSSFREILGIIPRIWDRDRLPSLTLHTDEHEAYPRAIGDSEVLAAGRDNGTFIHHRVSSRRARTMDNPLFPVNYLDRELRKDMAAHRRETTCWTRNVSNGLNRLAVYMFWHNYRKPWRVKTARILEPCHAIVAGADEGMLSAAGIRRLKRRSFLSQLDFGAAMLRTWMKAWETPLRGSVNYLPAYAVT
jgi:transposase-like protein